MQTIPITKDGGKALAEDVSKLQMYIPLDVHRRLRRMAADTDRTIRQVIIDLVMAADSGPAPEAIGTMDDAIAAIHKAVLEQATPEIREQVRGILREIAKRSK